MPFGVYTERGLAPNGTATEKYFVLNSETKERVAERPSAEQCGTIAAGLNLTEKINSSADSAVSAVKSEKSGR